VPRLETKYEEELRFLVSVGCNQGLNQYTVTIPSCKLIKAQGLINL